MKQRLLLLILGWYLTSVTLSIYNKWMFDPHRGMQVVCPITVTSFHQFLLWILSLIYVKWRPSNESNRGVTRAGRTDLKFYLRYVVPTAVASAGDIGFGNVSFKFVALTTYTIIKSASIAFVLLFGCLFKLEQFHWKLVVIVGVMFFGVVMMVYEPQHDAPNKDGILELFGCLLVLSSSCLSGLRWVFTQLILRKSHQTHQLESEYPDHLAGEEQEESIASTTKLEKPHPVQTIYQLAPIMGLTLLLTALIVEKPFPSFLQSGFFSQGETHRYTLGSVSTGILLLMFPGFEVFLMTICEFAILQNAQVLTLSVAGIIKELLTVLCGTIFLHERLDGFHNWAGMTIVLLDVVYYNYFRYAQNKSPHQSEKDLENDIIAVSNGNHIDSGHDGDGNETLLFSRPQQHSSDSLSYELTHIGSRSVN